jgi:hypothetical protein
MCSVVWNNTKQIEVEKRKLQHIFNWTGMPGAATPSIVWYKTGVVISGPNGEVKVSNNTFVINYKVVFLVTLQCLKDFIFKMSFVVYDLWHLLWEPRDSDIVENYMLRFR